MYPTTGPETKVDSRDNEREQDFIQTVLKNTVAEFPNPIDFCRVAINIKRAAITYLDSRIDDVVKDIELGQQHLDQLRKQLSVLRANEASIAINKM